MKFPSFRTPDRNPTGELPDGNLRLPRFCDELNYAGYDQERGFFVLSSFDKNGKEKVNGLGFAIEIAGWTGLNDEIAGRLSSVISVLPPKAGLQVQCFSSPNITPQLEGFLATQQYVSPYAGDFYKVRAQRRVSWYRKASLFQIPKYANSPLLFRNLQFLLSVTLPATTAKLQNSQEIWLSATDVKEKVGNSLKGLGMFVNEYTPEDLIAWNYPILNPNLMFDGRDTKLWYEKDRPLRDQMIARGQLIRFNDSGDSILFGDLNKPIHVSMMSAQKYPDSFQITQASSLIGDYFDAQLNYPYPYLITLGIQVGDFEVEKQKITIKAVRAKQAAESPMARFMPHYAARDRDMGIVQESIARGEPTVQMYHQVMLFAPDAQSSGRSIENTRQIWRKVGIYAEPDKYMQKQALLASLPMGLDTDLQADIQTFHRFSTKTLFNGVNTMPLISDWSGTQIPLMLFFSRRGQVMSFNPFDNTSGNYNISIAGESGAGKSFVLNEIAVNTLGNGGIVRIIDIGRSFQKNCELLNGQFIEFSEKSQIRLNPFSLIKDFKEDVDLLIPMFGQMMFPTETISDYQTSLLNIALQKLWDDKKEGELLTVDSLIELLKRIKIDGRVNTQCQAMAVQLHPYSSSGQYGSYFKGEANINFENDLVVLELEELKNKPALQKVVMMLVMYKIGLEMYLSRDRRKVVMIDEAWDLMEGGNTAKFIETMYRRARKYNGCCVTGTQGIDDFFKNPGSTAALMNSSWVLMLQTKKASIESFIKSGRFPIDDHQKKVLSTVRTAHGAYSEINIFGPGISGVGRFVVDPYSLVAASSRADDMEAVGRYIKQGLTMPEAISKVLEDRGVLA